MTDLDPDSQIVHCPSPLESWPLVVWGNKKVESVSCFSVTSWPAASLFRPPAFLLPFSAFQNVKIFFLKENLGQHLAFGNIPLSIYDFSIFSWTYWQSFINICRGRNSEDGVYFHGRIAGGRASNVLMRFVLAATWQRRPRGPAGA